MKRILKIAGHVAAGLITFLGILVSLGILWMLDTWRNLSIDEMLYHLKAPKTGTDSAIIIGFLLRCLLPSFVVLVLFVFLTKIWKKRKDVYGYAMLGISLVLALVSLVHVWRKLDIGTYLKNGAQYSSLIDDNYVYPSEVSIKFPEKKRNLVYIYMESMENTFADTGSGGAFEENLIPNLTELSLENENFNGGNGKLNGGYVLNKGTYTMGALFTHSMGLPLIVPIEGNLMSSQESFMPNIDGIGDVLDKEGYDNIFLIGSEAVFGGRELFYRDHGMYEILDYHTAKKNGEIPEGHYVFWGYEDWRLFEIGKKKLMEKAQSGTPFNLTMLTVDTHFEDGYVCEKCNPLHGENAYADVYNCSDRLVSEFVRWIQQQDFYENTTIVLVGDHLTMDSDFCKGVDTSYDRKVFTTVINGVGEPEQNVERKFSTLDMFPTTLAALGVEIEGNRLGLGTNLYSSEQTLVEKYSIAEINNAFDRKSVMMEYLSRDVDMEAVFELYKDQWFYHALKFAMEKNILMKDGTFLAEEKVSRGELVQMLYQLEGCPVIETSPARDVFKDIKGAEYEHALNWACENSIISDWDNSRQFRGGESATREEVVLMLHGYAAYKGLDISEKGTLENMINVDQVSEYADDAMRWAVGMEFITGVNNNDLAPKGMVTKAQAATIVMRMFEKFGL